jgi:hypothetical protein
MSYNQPIATSVKYGVVKTGSTPGTADAGYFYSTQTQTNIASPNLVTMNGTGLSQGITVVGGTKLTVTKPSNYMLNIMLQFTKSTATGGNAQGFFWLRKNGIDVADSSSDCTTGTVTQGVIASWGYILPLNAGDYLEMAWTSTAANAILIATPATAGPPAIPANPSVRMTLLQV